MVNYLFQDCMTSYTGSIDSGSPGPANGWTFDAPFGPGTSDVSFGSNKMTFTTNGATEYPMINKDLPANLVTVDDVSGRWDFTEYVSTPNAETTYQMGVNNEDTSEMILVSLFGDGFVVLQFGPIHASHFYFGTWEPAGSGSHQVYFYTGSGTNPPSFYLDGNEVELTYFDDVDTYAESFPDNVVILGGGAAVGTTETSDIDNVFLMEGDAGYNTSLSC